MIQQELDRARAATNRLLKSGLILLGIGAALLGVCGIFVSYMPVIMGFVTFGSFLGLVLTPPLAFGILLVTLLSGIVGIGYVLGGLGTSINSLIQYFKLINVKPEPTPSAESHTLATPPTVGRSSTPAAIIAPSSAAGLAPPIPDAAAGACSTNSRCSSSTSSSSDSKSDCTSYRGRARPYNCLP